jgi:polo-like kinase 1
VKVGDFGLATRIDFDGERKRTMCGTPNYIAPEVLAKKGHSYEVDIWSIGCIMYTLLVGKPPFETKSLKETYSKIRKNDYFIPPKISNAAQMLIVRLLRADPNERPTPEQALTDEFFTSGYMPPRLPTSCLTTAPRFTSVEQYVGLQRKPLSLVNKGEKDVEMVKKANTELAKSKPAGAMGMSGSSRTPGVRTGEEACPTNEPLDCYLHDLYSQLTSCLATSPDAKPSSSHDDAEDPASQPVYWVSKWVDYSDKYGMGYQLCDNSVGVLFNDSTRVVLAPDGENMQYIDRENREEFHMLHSYPEALSKKVTLLKYFRNYMSEHLLKTGAGMGPREGDEIARLPHLRTWFRTRSAIVLHLSIGILQLNFFKDHTKVILCPRMGAVSYIDEAAQFRTFRLSEIEKVGCSKELATRLEYARAMVERLMTAGSGKAAGRGRTD